MSQHRELFGSEGDSTRDTFLGLPSCENLADCDAAVVIIGAPIATPYPNFGLYAADAPAAIRAGMAGSSGILSHHDFDFDGSLMEDAFGRVVDGGDLAADEADFAANRARITAAVQEILAAGAAPVVIGGDDSVPIPVFAAFAGRGPYTILQIDAHIDWRNEVRGERQGLSSTMRRASEMGWIERIVQVGMRSAGSARREEAEYAREWGAQIFTAQRVHAEGIAPILEAIPAGANVLATFDCDSLDPSIMPAVMTRAPGGLTYWQVVGLLQGVAAKAKLCGFNLVEFMPARDPDGLAALTAGRIIYNAAVLLASR